MNLFTTLKRGYPTVTGYTACLTLFLLALSIAGVDRNGTDSNPPFTSSTINIQAILVIALLVLAGALWTRKSKQGGVALTVLPLLPYVPSTVFGLAAPGPNGTMLLDPLFLFATGCMLMTYLVVPFIYGAVMDKKDLRDGISISREQVRRR